MPQLAIETYFSQIFWLIISFALTFWMVRSFIAPNLNNIISSRKTKINTDLLQAEQLRINAQILNEKMEKDLAKIKAESSAKIQQVQNEAQNKLTAQLTQKEYEIAEQQDFEEEKIKDKINNMSFSLDQLTIEIIEKLVSKLMHTNIDQQIVAKYVLKVKNN